ncbi:prolyl oligopeptidase family serine peptidase [uncultured Dokdonia sp.]|uniref:prolyl oligopeptidase family serine peptidase n=1 Tax=uncultured Dokdonia sp. TaxID=575653 RepID=UPI00260D15BA|nr:prolyl oligopeptidase family serine peptidase [uncultured Dokdonia sp.]
MRILVFFLLLLSTTSIQAQHLNISPEIAYDTYHGITVADPYRNIENIKDSVVVNWMKNQAYYSNEVLDSLNGRNSLYNRQVVISENSPYFIYGTRKTNDGRYFYVKKEKDSAYAYIAYRDFQSSKEHFLFDPSKNDITNYYGITYIKPNWKGNKVAIGLKRRGAEVGIVVILDVLTKKIDNIVLKNTDPNNFYGINWLPDDSGFIYVYIPYTDPNSPDYWLETKSVLYKLGTDPKKLNVILEVGTDKNIKLKKEDFPAITIFHKDDAYVYARIGGSSRFKDTYFKKIEDIADTSISWELLYSKEHKIRKFIPSKNGFYFLTALQKDNYQIAKTNMHHPDFSNYQIIAKPNSNEIIADFELTKDGIYYVTEKNGVEATLNFTNGSMHKIIQMPSKSGKITIDSLGDEFPYLWVTGSGWLNNDITYIYNHKDDNFSQLQLKKVKQYTEFSNFEVLEFEIPSHDGVMLPISIIKQKNVILDSNNPVLLYGYGSYGTIARPFFSYMFLTWIKEGGILVVPHVRGGGEKGNKWYLDGSKTKKFNTWKDLIAATEYLIDKKYTNPSKIAVWGTSAGGIMAGKAITTRPDLYATAVFISPAMNMLRSEIQPNGLNSIKEFGTVEKEDEFKALLDMDSYHSIKIGVKYPSVYVYAGAKDGRVVVWDSAKFVAKLQASSISKKPILFDVDFNSGHAGNVGGTNSIFRLYANSIAFLLWQTGHPDYQLKE